MVFMFCFILNKSLLHYRYTIENTGGVMLDGDLKQSW